MEDDRLERDVLPKVRLALARAGSVMFRVSQGLAWVGVIVAKTADVLTLKNYRPFKAELAPGCSDLVGWKPVVITAAMVGATVPVFTVIECKRPKGGVLSSEQRHFLKVVSDAGGIAGHARSPEEAIAVIDAWKNQWLN